MVKFFAFLNVDSVSPGQGLFYSLCGFAPSLVGVFASNYGFSSPRVWTFAIYCVDSTSPLLLITAIAINSENSENSASLVRVSAVFSADPDHVFCYSLSRFNIPLVMAFAAYYRIRPNYHSMHLGF